MCYFSVPFIFLSSVYKLSKKRNVLPLSTAFIGMAGGIVMLEGHVRISMQEGYHMREEDVFPVTHSVEIACNDNKLSPRTLHLQIDPIPEYR